MAEKKKMSTTQILIPKTKFILECILENFASDLGLTIQDNPANYELSLNIDRIARGSDFKLGYQRYQMDEEVEEEGLYLDNGSTEANFSTTKGEINLIYEINKSEKRSNIEMLSNISKKQNDLAARLANPLTTSKRFISSWAESSRNELSPVAQKRIYRIIDVYSPEEIQPFLQALIKYNK